VTTDSDCTKPIAANVLDHPFQPYESDRALVWTITYPSLFRDDCLAVVLDLASRWLVGWSLSEAITTKLVCDAMMFLRCTSVMSIEADVSETSKVLLGRRLCRTVITGVTRGE
jgi:hypothetical protein